MYSRFSSYVGLESASTVHLKKYQEYQAPPPPTLKIFEILATRIVYIDLEKNI